MSARTAKDLKLKNLVKKVKKTKRPRTQLEVVLRHSEKNIGLITVRVPHYESRTGYLEYWEADLDDKPSGTPKPSMQDANEPPQMDLKPGKGTPVEPEETARKDEPNDLASDLANVPAAVENKEPVEEQKVSPKDDRKQVDGDEYLPI